MDPPDFTATGTHDPVALGLPVFGPGILVPASWKLAYPTQFEILDQANLSRNGIQMYDKYANDNPKTYNQIRNHQP